MNEPLVSIVIPTYNRRHTLCDAVESCIDQTWNNTEIIIIDDGSSDGTDNYVIEKLSHEWPVDRVKYIKQENSGASAARNRGMNVSCGEYVQFLDSDDLLASTKIEKQVGILQKAQNRNAVCCHCYGRMGSVSLEPYVSPEVRIGISEVNSLLLIRQLCSRTVHGMQTSAPLWRRNHLFKHAGWREDISLGDDLEYHVRLLSDAESLCFIDEELFWVRDHAGSRLSSDKLSEESLASLIRTRESILLILKQMALWDAQMQEAFLGAMRTIYANALQLGRQETIRELENWLWQLSSYPKRLYGFQALILIRQILGRHFLLSGHKLLSKLSAR